MKNQKKCVICGRLFSCPPSSKNNLALFIKSHPEFFPNQTSAKSALTAIGGIINGKPKPSIKRQFIQYKGWTVLSCKEK